MTRIGLVLGAGGTVGQPYHAGVLAALEHDLGWDPRTAEIIVGTSAGSVTGTLLRLGVPASDLAAWAVEAPFRWRGRRCRSCWTPNVPRFPRSPSTTGCAGGGCRHRSSSRTSRGAHGRSGPASPP